MIKQVASSHTRIVAGDLWHAIRHERTLQLMLVILIFSIVCWQMPVISTFLYPFKLFVTTVHEACHALMARLTGGNVGLISISPDQSGLTLSMGGIRPLVTMAGYIGTSVFGGLLIWWGRKPAQARFVLQTIGTVIIALTIFYGGGGIFSFVAMFLIGLAILAISRKANEMVCHMFLLMLAVQTTLSSVLDIQTLFFASVAGVSHSDAKTMENMSGIPAIVWSVLWGVISVCILIFALWFSYRPQKSGSAPSSAFAAVQSGQNAAMVPGQDQALQDPALIESEINELKLKTGTQDKLKTGSQDSRKEKVKAKQPPKNK